MDRPSLVIYGGTILAGCSPSAPHKPLDIVSAFQVYGEFMAGRTSEAERADVATHLAAFLRDVDALAAPLGAAGGKRRGGGSIGDGSGNGNDGGAKAAGAANDAPATGDAAPVAVGRKRAR